MKRFVAKEIPKGHALYWRARYVIVDTEKQPAMHPDLGYTVSFADNKDQIADTIEVLEMAEARKIMVAGTRAEHEH